jgi:hypothetical protein
VGGGVGLFAFNPQGALEWKFPSKGEIDGEIDDAPAVGSDGAIYFGTEGQTFYAINHDGSLRWRFITQEQYGEASPLIAPNGLIYFAADESILALSPEGNIAWIFHGEDNMSHALGADGTIYASEGAQLVAINPGQQTEARINHSINPGAAFRQANAELLQIPRVKRIGLAVSTAPSGNRLRYLPSVGGEIIQIPAPPPPPSVSPYIVILVEAAVAWDDLQEFTKKIPHSIQGIPIEVTLGH